MRRVVDVAYPARDVGNHESASPWDRISHRSPQETPMKKLVTTLCAVAALAFAADASYAANAVRISQVYGGGGGSSGTYLNDYVELFNSSGSAVNIGGWSIQYGSATGASFGSTAGNMFVFPANTSIEPCSYLLVQCGSAGTAGVAFPVTPDFVTPNINISATSGKVALINNGTGANACSGNSVGGIYVDVVGFGTANCFEAAAAAGLNSTQSTLRALGGMTDTDSNSANFSINLSPVPHASGVANRNPNCLTTPSMNSTWGQLKSIYR
jgi:hypothetical protein